MVVGGGWLVAQTKYRVTPSWVEVGLDWIDLKLGWMLGWVVTIINKIITQPFNQALVNQNQPNLAYKLN